MKKSMLFTLIIFSISFASVSNIEELEIKLKKLYSLHGLECAPEEIGEAEAYLETLKGLKLKEDGKVKKVNVSNIDKLIYEDKAQIAIAKAEKKIYSDVDNDGVPCHKEIEIGTNPYVSDKKIAQAPEIKQKEPAVKKEEKLEFKPLKLHARIHFDFNKATIKKDYLPYLNVISRYLKTHKDLKVKIVGFTDSIGSKSYNDKLALKRAEAVKKYLIKVGIEPDRIEIVGKGKEDYLFDNNTPLNRFTNRRAEFFVMETK
jgi:outer membrane protein OmpA-like peptidoglycan-associated protein